MSAGTTILTGWLWHSAVGGGSLLLLAWLLLRRCRQPAHKQRLGEAGLLAALAVGVLSLAPGWLMVPVLEPEPQTPTLEQAALQPADAVEAPAEVAAPLPFVWGPVEEAPSASLTPEIASATPPVEPAES